MEQKRGNLRYNGVREDGEDNDLGDLLFGLDWFYFPVCRKKTFAVPDNLEKDVSVWNEGRFLNEKKDRGKNLENQGTKISEFRAQHSTSEKYMKGGRSHCYMNHIILEAVQPGMAHRISPWFEVQYVNHHFIPVMRFCKKHIFLCSVSGALLSFWGTFWLLLN